jgi:4-amino-4-deoxy-L-arabinose transferase-like glycosyltransferase/Tfp pilus assembly protein PilF
VTRAVDRQDRKRRRGRRAVGPGGASSTKATAASPTATAGPVPRRQVVLVVAVALLFRLLFWALYSRTPFFHQPVVDASFFDIWAQNIAAGRDFQPDVYFKPPLYPYVLAGLYRLFGRNLPLVYALQVLIGAASSVLVLLLGRRVFTPRIALAGALAAALLPIPPFLELQLLAEPLTTFLCLLALLWLLQAWPPAGPPLRGRLLLAGLAFGIAATGRPNLLVLPPVLAIWLGLTASTGRSAHDAHAWRAAAVLLLGAALAIAPVTLRNLRAGGELVPVCANFGVNLWTGNNPRADGTTPVPVGVQWDDLKLRCEQAGAGRAVPASRHLAREAWGYLEQDPGHAVLLVLKKALILLNAAEVRNNIGPAFLARQEGVFTLSRWWPGFWLLAPFALLGLAGARRWGRLAAPLWLYLAALAFSVLPFFVNARFRAPLLPVLALFAAAGVFSWPERWQAWRAGRRRPLLLGSVLLLAAAALVNGNWFGLQNPARDARDHDNLAGILAQGWPGRPPDPAAADRHFRRATELAPDDPDMHERYGQFLLQRAAPWAERAEAFATRKQWGAAAAYADSAARFVRPALAEHEEARTLFPRSFRSLANAGTSRLWLGDGQLWRAEVALADRDSSRASAAAEAALQLYDTAARDFQAALRVQRQFPEAAGNLGIVLQRLRELPPVSARIRTYQEGLRKSGLDNR